MNDLNKLSYLQKIHRYRKIAQESLLTFGFNRSKVVFLLDSGNILFRVYDFSHKNTQNKNSPFVNNQYLLRIHHPLEQKTDAINLEMSWLKSVREELNLPVPEPILTTDGNYYTTILEDENIEHTVTLLKWLRGKHIKTNFKNSHYNSQGKIMAQLHNHSESWAKIDISSKRRFDYNGLFHDDAGSGIPNSEAWNHLSNHQMSLYQPVCAKVETLMKHLKKKPAYYGFIHGDCGVDANVLFYKGNAHIIDFDGSGFGYYLYDLGIALEHCWSEEEYPHYLDSLLKGYNEYRCIDQNSIPQMHLFRAAFYVYMGLWSITMDLKYPDSKNKSVRHQKWLNNGTKFIENFLNS